MCTHMQPLKYLIIWSFVRQIPDGVHVFISVGVLYDRRVRGESRHRPLLHGDCSGHLVRDWVLSEVSYINRHFVKIDAMNAAELKRGLIDRFAYCGSQMYNVYTCKLKLNIFPLLFYVFITTWQIPCPRFQLTLWDIGRTYTRCI